MMNDIRHPDIPVGSFIHPASVIRQLIFIFIELRRKIRLACRTKMEFIPLFVPFGKAVAQTAEEIFRIRGEIAVGDNQLLFAFHQKRALFSRRFDGSSIDKDLGLPVLSDIKAVEPFFCDIERSIRSMDFKPHFFVSVVHS